jgi:hypothetical protein
LLLGYETQNVGILLMLMGVYSVNGVKGQVQASLLLLVYSVISGMLLGIG